MIRLQDSPISCDELLQHVRDDAYGAVALFLGTVRNSNESRQVERLEYHAYRDVLTNLGYASFGTCRDDLDGTRTDTLLMDAEIPMVGVTFFYLITAEEIGGVEGTLGFATNVERSNFPANACP